MLTSPASFRAWPISTPPAPGDVKGYDLTVQNCAVHASGASDIRITVHKELTADVSGASTIFYKGEAVVRDVRTSGSSAVKKSS